MALLPLYELVVQIVKCCAVVVEIRSFVFDLVSSLRGNPIPKYEIIFHGTITSRDQRRAG
ncbi:MAG: hypothetical protein QFX35_02980 [Candidatus Verstraetearchaeota archaeon]|nr:hypothetical protein [Candidatus Verstraetearchaeota archaeon]